MENKKNEINKDQKQEIKKDTDKVSGGGLNKATPQVGRGYRVYWNEEYQNYPLQGVGPAKVTTEPYNGPEHLTSKEARDKYGVPARTVSNIVKDMILTNPDHKGAHAVVGSDISKSTRDGFK